MEENKIKCPYCSSTAMIKYGHTRIGSQRYQCKVCGKRSTGDRSVIKLQYIRHNIKCVRCGSTNLKRSGYARKTGNDGYRYYCKDCGRKFVLNKRLRGIELLSEREKRLIIMYTQNLGQSAKQVSIALNLPYCRVLRYIREYKKNLNKGI